MTAYGPPSVPPVPQARRSRSGCWLAVLAVAVVVVTCAGVVGVGAWYWFGGGSSSSGGEVGQCFPAGNGEPFDTSRGPVGCSDPNALWKVTKILDGKHEGDVILTCGSGGDALIYLPEKDKSYCLHNVD
jgi:hypothetical protein